jgi:putative FmdB family regulatory protein
MTYEYKCKDSQHPYVEVRSISEDQKLHVCPETKCGSPLVRVFAAPNIRLNGAGFASSRTNV